MSPEKYTPRHRVRVVTAASLFDGHDAAINVMRRLIQAHGCEVVHLGHNRSVQQVVKAALDEDAQAIAISSYQGGHLEYFKYARDLLVEAGAEHIRIFGGGGGVIVPREVRELHDYGITRIYSPEDGRRMGLVGMISDLVRRADFDVSEHGPVGLPRTITLCEREVDSAGSMPDDLRIRLDAAAALPLPVVGITGTGGAGKSSFTDELVLRYLRDDPVRRVAILSIDPTRKRTGGALLGDRIRMNNIHGGRCFMRSLATRSAGGALSAATVDAVAACKDAGYDLVIVETSGIGQGDSAVMDLVDIGIYVMTPEYGAATQLEKIDMLDFADVVVVNKFDRRGAEDAFRDVRKQFSRNRELFHADLDELPVFGTISSQFNDPGVNAAYRHLLGLLEAHTGEPHRTLVPDGPKASPQRHGLIPGGRQDYLGRIQQTVADYHAWSEQQVALAGDRAALRRAAELLPELHIDPSVVVLDERADALLSDWEAIKEQYAGDELVYTVRGREVRQTLVHESLSHQQIRRVALPKFSSDAEILRWRLCENLPGHFPFTSGVFPLKRLGELPKRMFAGEGGPARTNARFHYLCVVAPVHRLSTAFDSATLYGEDPDVRPDIYGKVGEAGVSVPHLDDMRVLYGGFDLCAPTTSVSMTINGPAPILLAMYLNTAIDQAAESGMTREEALRRVRGTVQADILKEDQAQNTCIFSTEFALRMQGDIQQWFIENGVRNYYSVSISGYHIAEAGANPVSQLAFTLANGFTFVEAFLARGMDIDDFAPNLSFFFSNGMDPEYTVIGRVARRIWAVAMRERYGASERSQKLKYHIQTSGRSLHAREIQFNDVRTTLQALLALYDNCNSLHTNAYDEAITTPTEDSVRRAMAIQLILAKEFGLLANENALQGSFIVEELTDLVEEAVLAEFGRLDERGGVLGAMERQYQRGRIQEESLHYEQLKHSGELPLVGINTFEDPATLADDWEPPEPELRRATYAEKDAQIESVRSFQAEHADQCEAALRKLAEVALSGGNLFDELMDTVRVASLGQITRALYEVGGEYRRNL